MTEEAKVGTTKIEAAFDAAWEEIPNPSAVDKLNMARRMFTAGARAFSTMPLCEHGIAAWGIENCPSCTDLKIFPGYNKPFEAELPEGMTEGHLKDLQVEHETMRRTLLQILVKVGALDHDAVNAPWDAVNLVHFSGIWLSDGLPFAKSREALAQAMHKMLLRVERLENTIGALKTRFGKLESKGGIR